ncbi:hypothetical protein T02_10462 [Trichinella nativa]|uniref:Uncharacterized protein n=1 Tax=Trichinella nativa TaxID=6335 RepID=A0A0V1KU86_9BILA|nr:hypothetical protein T02_10462 [Trichinella nativa]
MKDQLIYAPWLLTRFCLINTFRNATDIFGSGMSNHSNTKIAT